MNNIKKDWMFTSHILLFLLGFLYSPLVSGEDKVLSYALELLTDKKVVVQYDENGDEVSIANGSIDYYLKDIGLYYFLMGEKEKTLVILEKITQESVRFELMKELINLRRNIPQNIQQIIKNQIDRSKDMISKITLYDGLTTYYLQNGEDREATAIFNRRNEIAKELEKYDEELYGYSVTDSLSLLLPFMKSGLTELLKSLCDDIDRYLDKKNNLEILIPFLEKYLELNQLDKLNQRLNKINNIASENPDCLYKMAVLMIKLEKYTEAKIYLLKAFKTIEKIPFEKERLMELAGFIEINGIFDNPLIFPFMANDFEFSGMIKKWASSNEKIENNNLITLYSGMNMKIIEFLVKKGDYQAALDLSKGLDEVYKSHNYKDFYYYRLALLQEKSIWANGLPLFVDKIKLKAFKIDLLLRAASFYRKSGEFLIFKILMIKANSLINKKFECKFPFGDVGDVVLEWLEGGSCTNAIEAISNEENPRLRALLMFELTQHCIVNNDLEKALEYIDKIDVSEYKALALSKYASKMILSCKEDKGVELFKKAIYLLVSNNGNYLAYILDDYLNARLYKKLVLTPLWEKSRRVD